MEKRMQESKLDRTTTGTEIYTGPSRKKRRAADIFVSMGKRPRESGKREARGETVIHSRSRRKTKNKSGGEKREKGAYLSENLPEGA